MQSRQLQHFGCIAVGQRVEYERLDNPLKDEPRTIRTTHTVKGIRECGSGALVTLKGDSSTIVHAFDSLGRVLDGFGRLQVLPNPLEDAVVDITDSNNDRLIGK
ncbi:hypothetical protein C3E97_028120 [Pseudomonas sp. MWU12-2115]|nr:hypothetical protein C3E97_028120 [Pseudomonas sp. MWU12-2115]